MSQRYFTLLTRHQRIDAELRAEQSRQWQDPARLQRLKRMKLAIKDRLAAITGRQVLVR